MDQLAPAAHQAIISQVVPAHHALQLLKTVCHAQMEVLAPRAHLDTIYQAELVHHVHR
jgi:hypothetical protein